MKKLSPFTISIIAFLLSGIIFGIIQNVFYGYMDAEGFIHDSLFLPLSAFCILIGSILILVKGGIFCIRKLRK